MSLFAVKENCPREWMSERAESGGITDGVSRERRWRGVYVSRGTPWFKDNVDLVINGHLRTCIFRTTRLKFSYLWNNVQYYYYYYYYYN